MGHPNIIASRHLLTLLFEQVSRVGDRRARAHRGRDYCCFCQHRVICASLTGCSYMQSLQYGHRVVSATATAINCLCKISMAPSLNASLSKAQKDFHRFKCILIEPLQPSEIFHIKHVGDSIPVG